MPFIEPSVSNHRHFGAEGADRRNSQTKPIGSGVRRRSAVREEQRSVNTDTKSVAQNDQRWDSFAETLTGKSALERTAREEALLDELRLEMLTGKIAPSFVLADDGKSFLPDGTQGAFIPGRKGQQGYVLIRPGMSKQQRRATAREEQGEAIAHRARQMGINVAQGDAGARVAIVFDGGTITARSHPDLFRAHQSDTAQVIHKGRKVTAFARQSSTPVNAHTANAKSFLNRVLSLMPPEMRSRLPQNNRFMDLDTFSKWTGIDKKTAQRLFKDYGVTLPNGTKGFLDKGLGKMYGDGVLVDKKSAPTAPAGTTSSQLHAQGVPSMEADRRVNGVTTSVTTDDPARALGHRAGFRDPKTGDVFMDEQSLIDTFGVDKETAQLILHNYGTKGSDGRIVVNENGVNRMYKDKVLTDKPGQPTAPPGVTVADLQKQGHSAAEANKAVWGTTTKFDISRLLNPNQEKMLTGQQIANAAFGLAGKKPGETMTAEEFRYYSAKVVSTLVPGAKVPTIGAFINSVNYYGAEDGTVTLKQAGRALGSGSLPMIGRTHPVSQQQKVETERNAGLADAGYAFFDLTDADAAKYIEFMDATEKAASGDKAALKKARKLLGELRSTAGPRMQPLFAGLPANVDQMGAKDFKKLDSNLSGSFTAGLNTRH